MKNRASKALVVAAACGILTLIAGCTGSLTPPTDVSSAPPDDDAPTAASSPAASASARPMVAKHDYDGRAAGRLFSTY
jgi:hypothetical protein